MFDVVSCRVAWSGWLRTASLVALLATSTGASAQSLGEALAQAYQNNPQLNAARAQLRVVNENVPQALSGYRPRVNVTGDVGQQWTRTQTPNTTIETNRTPGGVAVTVDQTLFNGWATDNTVRQAESSVRAQRETLRTVEQDVLLAAATAYMDVVRDQAILQLRQNFVTVLNEQLRATRNRFEVGEVTRTDVAQSESRAAQARANFDLARAQLNASRATYRRIIGRDPGRLNGRTTVERLIPNRLDRAMGVGGNEHPQVRAAVYGVDAAAFAVNVQEAALLPTMTVSGTLSQRWQPQVGVDTTQTASIVGRVTVPIFDGGVAPSRIRQARETLGQRRIEVDNVRDQIRALVQTNWGNLEAQRAAIQSAQAQIRATELALAGVREEARVGQRTTLDVLNAQQDTLDARVNLVIAERNRVVAAYGVLGAVGRLNVSALGLNVAQHDPQLHYNQIRDRWHGLRTPSGE